MGSRLTKSSLVLLHPPPSASRTARQPITNTALTLRSLPATLRAGTRGGCPTNSPNRFSQSETRHRCCPCKLFAKPPVSRFRKKGNARPCPRPMCGNGFGENGPRSVSFPVLSHPPYHSSRVPIGTPVLPIVEPRRNRTGIDKNGTQHLLGTHLCAPLGIPPHIPPDSNDMAAGVVEW